MFRLSALIVMSNNPILDLDAFITDCGKECEAIFISNPMQGRLSEFVTVHLLQNSKDPSTQKWQEKVRAFIRSLGSKMTGDFVADIAFVPWAFERLVMEKAK